MLSRRQMLGTFILSSPLLIAACATTPSITTLAPQILADAQAAVSETDTIVNVIQQTSPNSLTPTVMKDITTAEASAKALISSLSSATPAAAGATTLQQVEADLNIVLNAVGPVLQVVAAADPKLAVAVTAYDLIVPLIPVIEAWANTIISQIGGKASAVAPRKPIRIAYTLEQARSITAARLAAKKH